MTITILKRPYCVMDVANAIIQHFMQIQKPIDNQLLQKILYYAQCDYLRRTEEPLFSEAIYKWGHGPMLPIVYSYFKSYGAASIKQTTEYVVTQTKNNKEQWLLIKPDTRALSATDQKLIFALADEIAAQYRQHPFALVRKTRREPMWQKDYPAIKQDNMQIAYDNQELIAYFQEPSNWPWAN